MSTLTVGVDLTTINCGECGGTYAISECYRSQQHNKGGSWHCPYCTTGWGYSGQSLNEKLKKELAEKERLLVLSRDAVTYQARLKQEAIDEAVHFRKSRDGMKGQLKKTQKRVADGACPCCNCFFPDSKLAAHIKTKHPAYANQEPA